MERSEVRRTRPTTYAEIDELLLRHARRLPAPMAMGIRNATAITNTFVGPLPASNTETVVLTTPPIQPCPDNSFVFLAWQATIVAGTSCTSLSYQIRRGTTTSGALVSVNPWKSVAIATDSYTAGGFYFDLPGVVAGQQYSLTVIQGAASAAGTWQDGALIAMVL
jgi:hypothetical protein